MREVFQISILAVAGVILASANGCSSAAPPEAAVSKSRVAQFAEASGAAAERGETDSSMRLFRCALHQFDGAPADGALLQQILLRLRGSLPANATSALRGELQRRVEALLTEASSLESYVQLEQLHKELREGQSPAVAPMGSTSAVHGTGGSSDAVALFREGLAAMQEPGRDLERSHFLTQRALATLATHPAQTAPVWQLWREHLASGANPRAISERIDLLTVFANQLDELLLLCETTVGFEEIWKVRKEVLSELNAAQREHVRELAARCDVAAAKCVELKSLPERLESLRQATVFDEYLRAQAALASPGEDVLQLTLASRQALADTRSAIFLLLEKLEQELRQQTTPEASALDVEPAAVDAKGYCTSKMGEVESLALTWHSIPWERWLSQQDGEAAEKMMEPEERMRRLAEQFRELQHRRYNLWALAQIYSAETAETWHARLGQLDPGLLHHSVAALYASVQSQRLAQATDPLGRRRAVQAILGSVKVELSRF